MKNGEHTVVMAAVYIRISTDEDLQKWSLGGQAKELKELADRRGWTVYRVYKDTVSGAKSDRPGLNELRDELAEGKFSVILVVDQDRLSRMEPVDWELFKAEIRLAGVRIITPASEVDFADEDSELVSDIFNLFARHQRRKIKKAMRRGRMEAVERGNWLGKAPFGRVRKDKTLLVDPVSGAVVQKIFELYGYENMGSTRIANTLNSLKLLSPGGGKWDQTSVLRVLTNPVHKGEIESFVNGKTVKVSGVFEPTVPTELFALCQKLLQGRSKEHRWEENQKVTSLAAGVLVCGCCGHKFNVLPIHTKYKEKVYTYYYYRHRKRSMGKNVKNECSLSCRAEGVDRRIVKALQLVCSDATVLQRFGGTATGAPGKKRLAAKLDNLVKAEMALRQKLKKLVNLYLGGDWDESFLAEQRNSLTEQLESNIKEQQEVKQEISRLSGLSLNFDFVAEYLALLKNLDLVFPETAAFDDERKYVMQNRTGDGEKRDGIKYESYNNENKVRYGEMSRAEMRLLVKAVFSQIELSEDGALGFTCRLSLPPGFYCHPGIKGI